MSNLLIDTVFNCINFAVRIGVVLYLIKKYIAPKISSSITYEQESLKIFEQQHGELKNQSLEIENQIKEQEQLYFDLQNKFALWQAALIKKQQKYDQECKVYEQKLTYQLERKQYYAQRQMLIKQELPVILKQIEKDLHQKIDQDPSIAKKYITNLLDITTRNV